MSNKVYQFQKTKDERWGIFLQDRLLATVGNYEACLSMEQFLGADVSSIDALKAAVTYRQSINSSLVIN